MTIEEVREFKEVFDLFDEDRSGFISKKELGKALRSLGANPTEAEIEEMMQEADANRDGVVDFPEYLVLMLSRLRSVRHLTDPKELRKMFRILDRESTGKILRQEFKRMMTTAGDRLSPEEVEEVLTHCDLDLDGNLDFHTFVKLLGM